ncbi:MAG: DUF2950 family protein [Syntrophobacteraceae bacterium]
MISTKSWKKDLWFLPALLILSFFYLGASATAVPLGSNIWPGAAYKKAGKGQRIFRSPQDAVKALVGAMSTYEGKKLVEILGPEGQRKVFPSNSVADLRAVCDHFTKAFHEKHQIVKVGGSEAVLKIGNAQRAFPVPLENVRGYWRFSGQKKL